MMELKIRQNRPNPLSTRVWLNGHEITSGLKGLTVEWADGDITTATLSIFVDDLDVNAETIAHLTAYLQAKEAAA